MKKIIVAIFMSFLLGYGGAYAVNYSQDEAINVTVYEKINPSTVFSNSTNIPNAVIPETIP